MNFNNTDAFIHEHLNKSILELSQLCAQPSVAAQNWGMVECALLVKKMLEDREFDTQIIDTPGAPVVFGERKGRTDKTLLIYNHYDVQPPEPLELWHSPPFEPTLREGKLYARGVSDDKGTFVSRLFAIDALLAENGELPCNIKFVVEGEEEVGSVNLHQFVRENKNLLEADACIWEFGGVDHREIPVQYLGLRGICYVELSVETASIDVHSGTGGSIFPNSAWRLVWALATLKDSNEKILIPGFYDPIVPPSEKDIELLSQVPDHSNEYKKRFGIKEFIKGLEGGLELEVASIFDPTCTICGLNSGYQGEGPKTVQPARASAKVDFRLVPNQHPEIVLKQLRNHLDSNGFDDIKIELLSADPPARTDPDDPFVKLVSDTAEDVYGYPMMLVPMSGGSGPNHPFIHDLGLPVATAGIGYPGTQAHAPNENIRLDLYTKGAMHIVRIIDKFSVS